MMNEKLRIVLLILVTTFLGYQVVNVVKWEISLYNSKSIGTVSGQSPANVQSVVGKNS